MAHWRTQQWATFARNWWLYDAKMQCPMLSGERIAGYLIGRHKPIYDYKNDHGDHVIVINTRHIAAKDNSRYWKRFLYTNFTRFGGYRLEETMEEIHRRDPTRVLLLETRAHLPRCENRHNWLTRYHLYPEGIETVPEDKLANVGGMIRQVMARHKRLDEYTQEELDEFPKLFDWPEDFALGPTKPYNVLKKQDPET